MMATLSYAEMEQIASGINELMSGNHSAQSLAHDKRFVNVGCYTSCSMKAAPAEGHWLDNCSGWNGNSPAGMSVYPE